MLRISLAGFLLAVLTSPIECGIFSTIGNAISSTVNSGENDIENALGINKTPAPAGSFLAAEAPVPMYSLTPDAGSQYGDLKELLTNSSGPIVWKTAAAMLFLLPDAQTDTSLGKTQTVTLTNGTGTVFAAFVNSTLVLAFNSTNSVYSQLLTEDNSTSQSVPFLSSILSGANALPQVMQPVSDLINGNMTTSLDSITANVTGGQNPARILTTGFGAGGGMAQLAAIYFAVTWTDTLIRCITFGAPPVMNGKAGFAFDQFVDLPYVWAYNGSALVNTVLRTTDNNTNPTVDGTYTLQNYSQAIIDAGAYAQSNGTTVSNPGIGYEVANSNAAIPSAEGLFGAVPETLKEVSGVASAPTPVSEFANQTLIQELIAAPAPKQASDCPLILCKLWPATQAACGTYTVYPPNAPAFVPNLQALPPAQEVITQPDDTHVDIDWNPSTRTALFLWRGSITDQDWLQDAKLELTGGGWLLSPQVAALFPGLEMHLGFSEQFQEVTSLAANTSVNIADILQAKMGTIAPEIVVCSGHSLGAALASICAVWAAIQYPSADILSVTMGQPYTGNQVFVDAYRLLVGREYRIVHQYDIVPSIPPLDDYRHVGLGIWELDGQIILESRPSMSLDDLNWNDHACYNYSQTLLTAQNVTILPNATVEFSLPESSRGG